MDVKLSDDDDDDESISFLLVEYEICMKIPDVQCQLIHGVIMDPNIICKCECNSDSIAGLMLYLESPDYYSILLVRGINRKVRG